MILALVIAPFLLQGFAISADEFYFHHRRGLGLWERLGHPLDTLSLLACYAFIMTAQMTTSNFLIYAGLSVFSCLLVTKDEFVHHRECPAPEQWLHSVLFILHPITLIFLGLAWNHTFSLSAEELQFFQSFIKIQFVLICLFFSYQIIYWSLPWKKARLNQR